MKCEAFACRSLARYHITARAIDIDNNGIPFTVGVDWYVCEHHVITYRNMVHNYFGEGSYVGSKRGDNGGLGWTIEENKVELLVLPSAGKGEDNR